jgi:hypothetical protein
LPGGGAVSAQSNRHRKRTTATADHISRWRYAAAATYSPSMAARGVRVQVPPPTLRAVLSSHIVGMSSWAGVAAYRRRVCECQEVLHPCQATMTHTRRRVVGIPGFLRVGLGDVSCEEPEAETAPECPRTTVAQGRPRPSASVRAEPAWSGWPAAARNTASFAVTSGTRRIRRPVRRGSVRRRGRRLRRRSARVVSAVVRPQ